MANAGPNTNGSQFFIVHGDDAGLPPNYTIFGILSDGVEVLDALAESPVTSGRSGESFEHPRNGWKSRQSRLAKANQPAGGRLRPPDSTHSP